jgi:hypothetical protein
LRFFIKKPQTNVYGSPCAPQPLDFIARVAHVDSRPANRDSERDVMLLTKWDREPCDVITSSCMVQFHVV